MGVWVSHGEGKFQFPYEETSYDVVAKYGYEQYPANPNGSGFNTKIKVNTIKITPTTKVTFLNVLLLINFFSFSFIFYSIH